MTDTFDRVRQQVADHGGRLLGPKTIVTSPSPLSNDRTSHYIVETARVDEPQGPPRLTAFISIMDGDGHDRIVLPHDVVETIYQQRVKHFDRSTPQSRERARKRRSAVERSRELHAKGRHEDRPVRRCPDCRAA